MRVVASPLPRRFTFQPTLYGRCTHCSSTNIFYCTIVHPTHLPPPPFLPPLMSRRLALFFFHFCFCRTEGEWRLSRLMSRSFSFGKKIVITLVQVFVNTQMDTLTSLTGV